MKRRALQLLVIAVLTSAVWQLSPAVAEAGYGWDGQRRISYQDPRDLFYNYYAGPQPSGAAAQMYVSPLPTPAHVGHTWNTYQPLYPHEFMYGHNRAYYTHHTGAGWTRTKVRYNTGGGKLHSMFYRLCK